MKRYDRLDDHKPLAGQASICLYDHEEWPCTVQQIRSQVADAIEREIQKYSPRGPEWIGGAQDAADVARGPHESK